MADKKTVRLTHPNGVNVSVRSEQKETLLAQGFTEASGTKSTSTSPKSSSK